MSLRPFSADLSNSHATVPLAQGDALLIKAQDATSVAQVSLLSSVSGAVVYAGATTAAQALLQVGPFASGVMLQINGTGSVRVETSVAGLSVAV